MLPIDEPDHLASGGHDPALLAGQVDAGRAAEAEAVDPVARRGRPRACCSRSAIVIAPTLIDCDRICAVVSVTQPRSSASWIVRSATWIGGGRLNDVSGVTTPSVSAPATVNALNVEPGS